MQERGKEGLRIGKQDVEIMVFKVLPGCIICKSHANCII